MDDSAWIFTVLLIAGLVYWMWRANNPKKPEVRPEPEGMTFTKGPGPKPPEPSEDPFLVSIEREREAAERQARDERLAYKKEIEARIGDDEKLKARLTQFAKDNKLDVALSELWDEIRTYPAWSQRQDWDELNRLGIENPRKDPVDGLKDAPLRFTYQGTDYLIVPTQWNGEDETYMDFQLFENGEEMFATSCIVVYSEYATYYRPLDVKAFKKRGDWASMLIKLFAKKKLESDKRTEGWRAKAASDIKERFSE